MVEIQRRLMKYQALFSFFSGDAVFFNLYKIFKGH